jgi:hypothetical protein
MTVDEQTMRQPRDTSSAERMQEALLTLEGKVEAGVQRADPLPRDRLG